MMYDDEAVGNAWNISVAMAAAPCRPKARQAISAATGISANLANDASAIGRTHCRACEKSSAAPTHNKPSGSDAWPSALNIGSMPAGSPQPVHCSTIPIAQATISGLSASPRTSARTENLLPRP